MNWLKRLFGSGESSIAESATSWALFFKLDDGHPERFFEIRRNGRFLWSAEGRPFTMGECQLQELPSDEDASQIWERLIAGYNVQGLICVHADQYLPGTFDFDALRKAIKGGA